jgi:hypothetical protein
LEHEVSTSEVCIMVVKTGRRSRGVAQGTEIVQFVQKKRCMEFIGDLQDSHRTGTKTLLLLREIHSTAPVHDTD